MWTLGLAVLAAVATLATPQAPRFKVIREWKYVNFTWPDHESYLKATDDGVYVPGNVVISGLKYYDGYYYITLPRMKAGVPATLTRIPAPEGGVLDTAPPLDPYPSWDMNMGDCDKLQNVQNIEIDPSGRIWIIDGGRTETLSQPIVKCPPKLIIHDIKRNETVRTYEFPEEVASFNGSYLYDLVLDLTDGDYAYITDNSGRDPGLIVYSYKENTSWKIRHSPSMRADPTASRFQVNEVTVNAAINIAGIALGPSIRSTPQVTINDERQIFYAPLSSLHLYSVNSSVLKDKRNANDGNEYQGTVTDHGLKASQSVSMTMDDRGNLYYNLLATNSIARWNANTDFQTGQKSIARDAKYLQWVNSFTFDRGNLTVLVNKLNKYLYGGLNINEENFRIITAFIDAKSYLYDNYGYMGPESTTMHEMLPEVHVHNSDMHDHTMMDGEDHVHGMTDNPIGKAGASAIVFNCALLVFMVILRL